MQPSTPVHRSPRSVHGGDVLQWGVFAAAMVEGQGHCVAHDAVTPKPASSNAAANHATLKRLSHQALMFNAHRPQSRGFNAETEVVLSRARRSNMGRSYSGLITAASRALSCKGMELTARFE